MTQNAWNTQSVGHAHQSKQGWQSTWSVCLAV